jgi:autotransporter-associated beta strand protein
MYQFTPALRSSVSSSFTRRRVAIAKMSAATGLAVSAIPQLAGAQTLTPIAVSGYTLNVIATTSPASASTTAEFDAYNGYVFYTQGYPNSDGTSGIPDNGTIVSQSNSNTTFQLAPLQTGTSNVLLFNNAVNAGGAPQVSSGTLSLTTPGKYSSLAFLNADANGSSTVTYTLNFAGGATESGSFTGLDWYASGPVAIGGLGRVSVGNEAGDLESGDNGYPQLFEDDITNPDPNLTLNSISFSFSSPGGSQWGLFAVSGTVVLTPEYYVGIDPSNSANNGKADTTSLTFNQGGTASPAIAGQPIVFDDTATGPTTVTIGAAGIAPQTTTFNNSSLSYTLTGGGITGSGGLNLTGTGSVTLDNVNTYTGDTVISAGGTLVIGSGGSIASPTVAVLNGTFNIASGGQTGGTPLGIVDTGTVNLFNSTQTLRALTGNGVLNVNGTALTVGPGTFFSGTIGGSGGSLNIAGGTIVVSSASNISGVTGNPITVGTGANTASLLISDNSATAFSGTTLTIGSNGTLGTTGGSFATYAGPIVLSSTNAAPSTIAQDGAQFMLPSSITGNGALSLAGTNGGSFLLSGNNTYNGNTIVTGDPVGSPPSNTITVQLGSNTGFSPNGGLVVNSNSNAAGNLNVDLHGYSPTVQFLSGTANPNYAIVNNGGTTSTLTITNVNTSTGTATFGTAITGNIAVVKAGTTGNQIFDGASTYTGGTTITGGTLTAESSGALGAGTVTLAGGTLGLQIPGGPISGFSGFHLNTNGVSQPSISTDNSTLTLTKSVGGEGASGFTGTPQKIGAGSNFTANFTYNVSNPGGFGYADGITFTIENDPNGANALGASGGSLGYEGIQNSLSVQFDLYNDGYGVGTDGNINKDEYVPNSYIYDSVNVAVNYNASAQTLTVNLADQFGDTDSTTENGINLNSILGGTTAYVGFTGGDGGGFTTQQILNFNFDAGSVTTPAAIGNAVTTAPGTVSTLSAPVVVTGQNVGSVGSLNIASGSTLHIVSAPTTSGTRLVLTTSTLTIDGTPGASTGTLDLENNDLVVTNGSLSDITKQVGQGYNLVGGANWKGKGITSSAAAADSTHLTALGVIQNNQNGTPIYSATNPFDGYAANGGDILVKYTYFGDANLDGKVDGSDYSLIDYGYSNGLTGWLNGDFNYDGVVDGSDYSLIDNAYNNQTASLTSQAEVAASTALVAGPTAVPEPASLGLLALGVTALAGRRRRM